MELHDLKGGPRKNVKRVGRGPGSGNGKTSGKGHKGQQSRAGYSRRFGFEGGQNPLHRRLPQRGFTHMKRWEMAVVNLDVLDENFDEGSEINKEMLVEAGRAHDLPGGVKILARGEITKKFTVRVQAVSESARVKIEAAGGTVELLPVRAPREDAAAEKTGE